MHELLAIAACLPCVLAVRYLASRLGDRSAQRALWMTFALGALSTVVVIALAALCARPLGVPMPAYARDLGNAFLVAALPEEAMKFLVVVGFAASRHHLRDERSGVAHGLAASLGFASVEMVLSSREGGLEAAVVRTLTTAPFHAFLGTLMGSIVGRAARTRLQGVPLRAAAPGLAVPMVVHGAYDLPLMSLARASSDPGPRGAWTSVGLASVGVAVLVVGCLVGHHIFRGVFPREPGAAEPLPREAMHASAGRGAAAWVLIPIGGMLASCGAWIVGSLLFAEFQGIETVPNAARATVLLGAVGLALLCFGLAIAFRGIRLRHPAPLPA